MSTCDCEGGLSNRPILRYCINEAPLETRRFKRNKEGQPFRTLGGQIRPSDNGTAALTKIECATHKNKSAQVRSWIEEAYTDRMKKLLVLTGPPGSGKTACIRAIANELRLQVIEWENPFNQFSISDDPTNQVSFRPLFRDFLMSATRSAGLSFRSSNAINRSLFLVEDIPNLTLKTKRMIHDAQRELLASDVSCPVVFIISTSGYEQADNSGVCPVLYFCPFEILKSPYVTQIGFNAVAKTYLLKAISRIADLEWTPISLKIVKPKKVELLSICESSGGDIRSAIYSLQFNLTRPSGSARDFSPSIYSALGTLFRNTSSEAGSAGIKSSQVCTNLRRQPLNRSK